jgi:hypothetical protein
MKKRVKKLWVEALRSGEFRQGKGALHPNHKNGGGYCCLGVLCELHRRETGEGKWQKNAWGDREYVVNGHSSDSDLPLPVMEWAGLTRATPILIEAGSDIFAAPLSAAGANDGDSLYDSETGDYEDVNLDFDFIAAMIETEL